MKTKILIGVAGMLGALLRVGIGQWIGEKSVFPIATLIVNLLATFVLMLFSGPILEKFVKNQVIRQAMTIGFLGALSTFSAFSVETLTLLEAGHYLVALAYVFISIVGGLIVAIIGYRLGEKWVVA
ncbi:MAG TPA: CrcB family protein [Sporosarcina sp.]|nr:CrcB family protein [Sporosarcina sp.]